MMNLLHSSARSGLFHKKQNNKCSINEEFGIFLPVERRNKLPADKFRYQPEPTVPATPSAPATSTAPATPSRREATTTINKKISQHSVFYEHAASLGWFARRSNEKTRNATRDVLVLMKSVYAQRHRN